MGKTMSFLPAIPPIKTVIFLGDGANDIVPTLDSTG